MSNYGKNGSNPSLCWDCKNCTKPSICSWARDFTPVKGWLAEPTRLGGAYPMDSYLVKDCPLFSRGSFKGGSVEDLFGAKQHASITLQEVHPLACAIIERYVLDWKMLEYGALSDLLVGSQRITRVGILKFFASQWFGDLLSIALPDRDPPEIWEALKMTPSMLKEVMRNE